LAKTLYIANEKEINEYLEAFIQINPKFADAWILEIEE